MAHLLSKIKLTPKLIILCYKLHEEQAQKREETKKTKVLLNSGKYAYSFENNQHKQLE